MKALTLVSVFINTRELNQTAEKGKFLFHDFDNNLVVSAKNDFVRIHLIYVIEFYSITNNIHPSRQHTHP